MAEAMAAGVRIGSSIFHFGSRTYIMGVLNVTPDSFSDGGLYFDPHRALDRAWEMVEEGADIIDIGAASASYGARRIGPEEEIARLRPVLALLADRLPVPLSVDTYRAAVAEVALDAGVAMINDITGLRGDPALGKVVARYGAAVVVMHMLGLPDAPERNPRYVDVVQEAIADLKGGIERAEAAGIRPEAVIVDPGIGVAKQTEHNLALLQNLRALKALGRPLLLGASRTSVIGNILEAPVHDRLEGTLATTAVGVAMGVDMVRVHDVRANARVARMADAMVRGWEKPPEGWAFDAITGARLRELADWRRPAAGRSAGGDEGWEQGTGQEGGSDARR